MDKSLGKHVILELYGCDSELIDRETLVHEVLLEAAKIANATVISSTFHQFSPQGVSGMIIIEESHFSIHTWPEHGYAAIDMFTCGDILDNMSAVDYVKEKFKAKSIYMADMRRGIIDGDANLVLHELQHETSTQTM
jgi:S-adenosylmethionine decarboxylase